MDKIPTAVHSLPRVVLRMLRIRGGREKGDVGDEGGAQRRSDGIRACLVLSDLWASALSASGEEENTMTEISRVELDQQELEM